jgi:hypothetical protein
MFGYGSSFGGCGAGAGLGALSGFAATISVYGDRAAKSDDFYEQPDQSCGQTAPHPSHARAIGDAP